MSQPIVLGTVHSNRWRQRLVFWDYDFILINWLITLRLHLGTNTCGYGIWNYLLRWLLSQHPCCICLNKYFVSDSWFSKHCVFGWPKCRRNAIAACQMYMLLKDCSTLKKIVQNGFRWLIKMPLKHYWIRWYYPKAKSCVYSFDGKQNPDTTD